MPWRRRSVKEWKRENLGALERVRREQKKNMEGRRK